MWFNWFVHYSIIILTIPWSRCKDQGWRQRKSSTSCHGGHTQEVPIVVPCCTGQLPPAKKNKEEYNNDGYDDLWTRTGPRKFNINQSLFLWDFELNYYFANAWLLRIQYIIFFTKKIIFIIFTFLIITLYIYIFFTYTFIVRRTMFIVETENILINNNNNKKYFLI